MAGEDSAKTGTPRRLRRLGTMMLLIVALVTGATIVLRERVDPGALAHYVGPPGASVVHLHDPRSLAARLREGGPLARALKTRLAGRFLGTRGSSEDGLAAVAGRVEEALVVFGPSDGRDELPIIRGVAIRTSRARDALAAAASIHPAVFDRFVRPRFPIEAGVELIEGVVHVAAPNRLAAELGNAAFSDLFVTVVGDVIVATTRLELLRDLRRQLEPGAGRDRRATELEGQLTAAVTPDALGVVARKTGEALGGSSSPWLGALLGLDLTGPVTLRLESTSVRTRVTIDMPGPAPWASGPLSGTPVSGIVTTSLSPAAATRRLLAHASESFVPEEICRAPEELATEAGPRPRIADRIAELGLEELPRLLEESGAGSLTLGVAPPAKDVSEPRPSWVLACRITGRADSVVRLLGGEQAAADPGRWTELALRDVAGFVGRGAPWIRVNRDTLRLASDPVEMTSSEDPGPAGTADDDALWRLRCPGDDLARLVEAIATREIALLARPTLAERRRRWLELGRDADDPGFTTETDALFARGAAAAAARIGSTARDAAEFLRVFGSIAMTATREDAVTRITLEVD